MPKSHGLNVTSGHRTSPYPLTTSDAWEAGEIWLENTTNQPVEVQPRDGFSGFEGIDAKLLPNVKMIIGEEGPIVLNTSVIEHGYGGSASPFYAGELIVKIGSFGRPITSEDVGRALSIIPKDAFAPERTYSLEGIVFVDECDWGTGERRAKLMWAS